jgi:hypothetical protein
MDAEGTKDCSPFYSGWYGTPVLLFVIRQCHVPIPCNIIGESLDVVRIRIQPRWEVDVPKRLILAFEEAALTLAYMN